jgi:CheY-like chemotaxis protein
MSTILLSSDLVFSSKASAAATRGGGQLQTAMSVAALFDKISQQAPKLVVLDLTVPGLDPADVAPRVRAAAPGATIIAYGPHVQEAMLEAAQAAGCDQVLTRGQWNVQMDDLLASHAGAPALPRGDSSGGG